MGKDTIQHFTEEKTTQGEQEKVDDDDDDEDIDPEKDVLTKEDSTKRPSIFKDVFSDVPCYEYTPEDEEEEEDLKMPDCTEKEPNFTGGVHTFIQNCRRRHRQQERCEGVPIQAEDVGVEDRLMGCAVFEEKWMCTYDMTYIFFLAVRPQSRNYQMGQYLISQCLDSSVVGDHDYVVTHANSGVDKFFRKFGFTDDKAVNSQWRCGSRQQPQRTAGTKSWRDRFRHKHEHKMHGHRCTHTQMQVPALPHAGV